MLIWISKITPEGDLIFKNVDNAVAHGGNCIQTALGGGNPKITPMGGGFNLVTVENPEEYECSDNLHAQAICTALGFCGADIKGNALIIGSKNATSGYLGLTDAQTGRINEAFWEYQGGGERAYS